MKIFEYKYFREDKLIYFLKYTDDISGWKGGEVRGCFIKIRLKWKGNIGLLEHEKQHVRQAWRSWGLYGLRYLWSKRWRLRYEVEAYRVQLKYSPSNEEIYAGFLSTWYDLDITKEQAITLLK